MSLLNEIIIALIGLAGIALSSVISYRIARRKQRSEDEAQLQSAQDSLIDQLQEELQRYRKRTDERLDQLETLSQAYRAFIGVQRDHMAEHGIPLPLWPENLPR